MGSNEISVATWIKLSLAALMLLCLLPMSFGFYNLVRFLSMIGFAILAVSAYKNGQNTLAVVYGSLVLMFQPFIKLVLGRDVWNIVDAAVAVFLIMLIVQNKEIQFHKQKSMK